VAAMGRRRRGFVAGAAAAAVAAVLASGTGSAEAAPRTTVEKYGWKDAAGYDAKWVAAFGAGEGTVSFKNNTVTVDATPFTTGADSSVFDHLKYIRTSAESFAVPAVGSVEFSVDIEADTPGTQPGRVVHGCYGLPGTFHSVSDPCARPFQQTVLEGQQAGVVLNMVNFQTGQLFDWFVSDGYVFALIERLPSNVTGSPGVRLDKAYTQIIKQAPMKDKKHTVSIRYTRGPGQSYVEYLIDNKLFSRVDHVGVPLDKQGVPFTGYAPSLGNGEQLSLDSFVIGHGLFSLLDAFPYQHPDRPDLSVSIPLSERLFGQGAVGTWKDFLVTTKTA
jgi:hypothetical protein